MNPETPTGPAAPGTRRRLAWALVTVALILVSQVTRMLPVFRGSLLEYFGIDDGLYGILFAVPALVGTFSVLVGGYVVDRWGPRAALRVGLTGTGVSLALIAVAGPRWPVLAVAFAVHGLFARSLGVALGKYMTQLFPRNLRRALSLNLAAGSAGGFIWPTVAEGLLKLQRTGSASLAAIVHVPAALAAVVVAPGALFLAGRGGTRAESPSAARLPWRRSLPERPYVLLVGLMALHGLADTLAYLWMARFLGSDFFAGQWQPVAPGIVLTAQAVAYVVTRSLLAVLPEHLGRRSLMVLPGVLGGSVLAVGVVSGNYVVMAASYVLGAALWSLEFPAMLSVLARRQPERFGTGMALQQCMTSALVTVGMPLMGLLVAHLGEASMWQALLVPAAIYPGISAGAALWLKAFGAGTSPEA